MDILINSLAKRTIVHTLLCVDLLVNAANLSEKAEPNAKSVPTLREIFSHALKDDKRVFVLYYHKDQPLTICMTSPMCFFIYLFIFSD